MIDTPLNIRRFETLQIVSIAVGLINGFAVIQGHLLNAIVSAVVVLALTLLVSRRRKNWARWALLGLFVLGAAFAAWNAPTLFTFGYTAAAIALTVDLMNAVAVILLFTPESANWLRSTPSPA